jgi:tetratricopeptide (TPR) repeat protein
MKITRTMVWAAAIGAVLAAGCGQSQIDQNRKEARQRWDEQRAQMVTKLAEGCYQHNELNRARQHIEELIKSGAMYAPAYELGARLAVEKGDLDKAGEYAATAVRIDPDSPEAHYVLGTVEQTLGHVDQALEEFTAAAELGRTNGKYALAQAEMLVSLDRPDEALTVLRETVDRLPGKADAHTALGDVLVLQKQYEEAVGSYRIAMRLCPSQVGLKERLATALFRSGAYGEAEPILAELGETAPNGIGAAWTLDMRSTCLLALGRTAEARALCTPEVQARATSAAPLVVLAQCDILENQLVSAQASLEAALKREPEHAQANALMGYVLMAGGRPGEAVPHLKLALRDPACEGRPTIEYLLARAEKRPG